jgi:hypothetical protein
MKAISIRQPWLAWIMMGLKIIETREHDRFKGLIGQRIALHAAQKYDMDAIELAWKYINKKRVLGRTTFLTRGAILCTVYIYDAKWLDSTYSEKALIDCSKRDKFGLFLTDIKIINPYICKGRQGIFNLDGGRK